MTSKELEKTTVPDLAGRDAWQYPDYVTAGLQARERHDGTAWELGDLAAGVPLQYGARTLERFAADIGVSYATLREYRRVASKWPQNARRLAISWSVHQALAALPHNPGQVLATRETWTLAQAREAVAQDREEQDREDEAQAALERGDKGPAEALLAGRKAVAAAEGDEHEGDEPDGVAPDVTTKTDESADPITDEPPGHVAESDAEPAGKETVTDVPAESSADPTGSASDGQAPSCGHDDDWHREAAVALVDVTRLREKVGLVQSKTTDKIAELEKQVAARQSSLQKQCDRVREVEAERDRLQEQVTRLKKSLDEVTADRDEKTRRLDRVFQSGEGLENVPAYRKLREERDEYWARMRLLQAGTSPDPFGGANPLPDSPDGADPWPDGPDPGEDGEPAPAGSNGQQPAEGEPPAAVPDAEPAPAPEPAGPDMVTAGQGAGPVWEDFGS